MQDPEGADGEGWIEVYLKRHAVRAWLMSELAPVDKKSKQTGIGRPPTTDWVYTLVAAAWLYEYERPERQADLERFIQNKLAERGVEAGETAIRKHARMIISAYRAWEADVAKLESRSRN